MALPRAIAGARRTGLLLTWKREDGSVVDLTGATLSGRLDPVEDGRASRDVSGSLEVVDPGRGQFRWTFAAADVVAGVYAVQFKATYSDGTYELSFAEQWSVETAL